MYIQPEARAKVSLIKEALKLRRNEVDAEQQRNDVALRDGAQHGS